MPVVLPSALHGENHNDNNNHNDVNKNDDDNEDGHMGQMAIFISGKAKPGNRDEIFGLYREILAPRAEENDDQTVVLWAADQQDPDAFHLFEIYADGAALEANAKASWFGDYMAKVGPLLAEPPVVATADPKWSKGL